MELRGIRKECVGVDSQEKNMFVCPSGLWCFPAKKVYINVPEVRILPQTLFTMICADRVKNLTEKVYV